jgi:hypothetical protein
MKKLFGILFFVAALFSAGCKSPSGPSDPPDLTKYYNLEITYIRVAIRDASAKNVIPMAMFGIPDGTVLEVIPSSSVKRIDDLTFQVSISKNPFCAGFYCVAVGDPALNDGIDKGTCITGIRIGVRVVETNIAYELSSIVLNVFKTLTYSTSVSTMARFSLKKNGTIEDY